ncbi:MAG: hypothetical protein J3K34DRAFT_466109 [Monoraphidium minutum]|nr:MAG: hypothetical protein J3K34DRAFT_466109 [Monoraphidium minutum]
MAGTRAARELQDAAEAASAACRALDVLVPGFPRRQAQVLLRPSLLRTLVALIERVDDGPPHALAASRAGAALASVLRGREESHVATTTAALAAAARRAPGALVGLLEAWSRPLTREAGYWEGEGPTDIAIILERLYMSDPSHATARAVLLDPRFPRALLQLSRMPNLDPR